MPLHVSTFWWMDAYLAAFAVETGMRLVTFDRGFQKFVPLGLNLLLLGTASAI